MIQIKVYNPNKELIGTDSRPEDIDCNPDLVLTMIARILRKALYDPNAEFSSRVEDETGSGYWMVVKRRANP